MGWISTIVFGFCIITIALCSVAFIYFEYRPTIGGEYSTPETRITDPKCSSNIYTDKYKKQFLGCK
jgi:hypothetical protein